MTLRAGSKARRGQECGWSERSWRRGEGKCRPKHFSASGPYVSIEMARMRSKKEREARKLLGSSSRGAKKALEVYKFAKDPVSTVVEKALAKASTADKVPMRRGVFRNRLQYYNSRTRKWVKVDTKTGRILGQKDTPWKNVRRKKNKKK